MAANGSIAIVDDEVGVVRTYELLFKRRNIPLSFMAFDGHDAIEKFSKANPPPIVVIIDYWLPDMCGLEVMKGILSMEPRTKIIFISGDESKRQESLDSGASVFMKKPTPIKEILDTINSLMKA